MTEPSSIDEILTRPKILFFGGSFDPVHIGHSTLPFDAACRLWGEEGWGVVYVPAVQSPHKDSAPTADEHRLAMLRIAIRGQLDASIWMHEINRGGEVSFWADTWAVVRERLPDADSRFLIGTDQAVAMHRWSRYRAFWRSAVVVMRDRDSVDELIEAMRQTRAWSVADLGDWRSMVVRTELVDASSTTIRAELGGDAKRKTRIEGLDPGVHDYILEHDLYRD